MNATMVEIRAIVRREMLDRVIRSLKESGVPRLTVTRVHAIGAGVDPASAKLSLDEGSEYADKALVQFVCASERCDMFTQLIGAAARTGRRGDGIVYDGPRRASDEDPHRPRWARGPAVAGVGIAWETCHYPIGSHQLTRWEVRMSPGLRDLLARLALLLMAFSAPAVAQDRDAEAVKRVVITYGELTQAKDLAGLDTLFAHDAWVQIIEGAGVNQGWADYRDNHIGPELAEFDNFVYRVSAVEPQLRGAVAWAPFRYELAADTERGHVEVEGRGTAVLERRAGRWVIVHLHTSGRRKPAP